MLPFVNRLCVRGSEYLWRDKLAVGAAVSGAILEAKGGEQEIRFLLYMLGFLS